MFVLLACGLISFQWYQGRKVGVRFVGMWSYIFSMVSGEKGRCSFCWHVVLYLFNGIRRKVGVCFVGMS